MSELDAFEGDLTKRWLRQSCFKSETPEEFEARRARVRASYAEFRIMVEENADGDAESEGGCGR